MLGCAFVVAADAAAAVVNVADAAAAREQIIMNGCTIISLFFHTY